MALEGVDLKILSYSPDEQRWTLRINKNVYDFYGVNPYIKRKLGQYIKHNNKKNFFELLKSLEYENITKKRREFYSPDKNDGDKGEEQKNGNGEQLSLFDEGTIQEHIKHRLRSYTVNS